MYVVNAMGVLRVSREGEAFGLDLHEHGLPAYPEYVITAAGRPSGLVHHENISVAAAPASAKAH